MFNNPSTNITEAAFTKFAMFNRQRLSLSEKYVENPESPETAMFVFESVYYDFSLMYYDRIYYFMLDIPQLTREIMMTNKRIISDFCNIKYSPLDRLKQDDDSMRNKMETFLNDILKQDECKIGNTAANITDSYIDRFANDPMPIQLTEPNEALQNAVDSLMQNSSWEDLLKLVIRDVFVCGIGVICLSIIEDEKGEKLPIVEYLDPLFCSFVMRGAIVKYAYYRPNPQELYIYSQTTVKHYELTESSKGNWQLISEVSHPFGMVPIQVVRNPKNVGLFEKCLESLTVFEIAPRIIRRDATDPTNNILTSNMQLMDGVHSLQAGRTNNISGGFEGQWLTKPERLESLKLLYDYSRYNISECTAYIFNQDFLSHPRETATKTKELMSRQQSLLRAVSVNLKWAVDRILQGFCHHLTTQNPTFASMNPDALFDLLTFEPVTQDVFSTYDILEMGASLLPQTEQIQFLKNVSAAEAERLFEQKLEQEKRLVDAQRGSQYRPEFDDFNPNGGL